MRTLAQLSDLHFGRLDETSLAAVLSAVTAAKPDIVAISGDLTQRARSREFFAARQFLNALPQPQIVVPGNHDVPLFNVLARFTRPLDKFTHYITSDLEPFFFDSEIAVAGVNTARGSTLKGGRINRAQVASLRHRFHRAGNSVLKIVVAHHPFDVPEGERRALVGRADMAMRTLLNIGVDVFLTGHLHLSSTLRTTTRYSGHGPAALLVQAGTATSNRGRGEANSFNLIHLDTQQISVERLTRGPSGSYATSNIERFSRTEKGWMPVTSASHPAHHTHDERR